MAKRFHFHAASFSGFITALELWARLPVFGVPALAGRVRLRTRLADLPQAYAASADRLTAGLQPQRTRWPGLSLRSPQYSPSRASNGFTFRFLLQVAGKGLQKT